MSIPMEGKCPHCGTKLDIAMRLSRKPAPPEPGSFAVCLGCASISVFFLYGGTLRLRPPTDEEFEIAMELPPIKNAILGIAKANRAN